MMSVGNQTELGRVNGIVYDDSQLSRKEAENATHSALYFSVSTDDVPTGGSPMADAQEFETAELGPAISAVVTETKAGYKTTEFWITILVSLLTVLDGIPLPEQYEAYVVGAIGAVYVLSRGLAKQGVANVEPVLVEPVDGSPPA